MGLSVEQNSGRGLERSCAGGALGWIRASQPQDGVELMQASFEGVAYRTHRHDTYGIAITVAGVQQFDYRGATKNSTAGSLFVLHPDEPHDGRAGSDEGFTYHQVYVTPRRISDAVRTIVGRPAPLPFVRGALTRSPRLVQALRAAFRLFPGPLEPLALDALVLELAEGLIDADRSIGTRGQRGACDLPALQRVRSYLEGDCARVVASHELEGVAGLSRYELARQFRRVFGTSPYRYLLLRRLDLVRSRIGSGQGLAAIAADTGFADQAHMSRQFKAAYGLTPAVYRTMLGGLANHARKTRSPLP